MGKSIAGGGGSGGRVKVFYGAAELENIAGFTLSVDGGNPGEIPGGLSGEPGQKGSSCLLPLLPGDLNNNGIVDFRDFSRFSENWLEQNSLE